MKESSWEGKIIGRKIDCVQGAEGQRSTVNRTGSTTLAPYLILYRTRHGSVTSHECALCLAGADGSHHLRSENPTWYHLKPFASLTSSFSFLYRVFLQAPSIDRFLSWPPLPVLGVLSHGRRQTVRRLGPPSSLSSLLLLLGTSLDTCGLNVSSPISPFPPTPREASANNLLNPPRANSFSKIPFPLLVYWVGVL